MEEHTLSSWEEFEESLQDLEEQRAKRQQDTVLATSEFLYRGQGHSAWRLQTTLDRFFSEEVSLRHYYRIILAAKPKIETFTGATWDIPTLEEYEQWLHNQIQINFLHGEFRPYEYLVYLRHHGFPSPLLDWTESPYIAAFFAFNRPALDTGCVSIFVYQEHPFGGKSGLGGQPVIRGLGPYVRGHKRHFFQQSQYTVCTVVKQDVPYYAPHEDVIAYNADDQDFLWKFNIPVGERHKVLTKLNRMNINAFSLFGSEDSLLEMIATTDIFLKGR